MNGSQRKFTKLEENRPIGRFLLAKLTLSKNSALPGANEAVIDLEQK